MYYDEFQRQLSKVEKFHGHLCGGIVMGTKMTMYALEHLGMKLNEKNKDLLVFVEVDRCMADAVQIVSGCTVGKRTLKLMDYGRFAATFYKISTGEGIRVTDDDIRNQNENETKEELVERLSNTPNKKLFSFRRVKLRLKKSDFPGKDFSKIVCPVCNEIVKDDKYLVRNGIGICRACAEESYYEFID
ncbi:MAG: FmdE family protein [Methanobrevibacter sp.]|jgi:formylmethanofuran dehydrogenase subunit E|nr:FmdE family protein [Candidatus Methanovirga basalitermitum]